jgi:predicted nuclease with TOPRIM domain|tara:strand:- start:428 stop:880 length:453 start_codon:yes stop_codon:yes gene_type:complete
MTTMTKTKTETKEVVKTRYTNRELAELMQGLFGVQQLQGIKFSLSVAKNIQRIKGELDGLDKASQPSPEFMELSQKVQMCEQKKDMEGIKKLEDDNSELVETRKKQLNEVDSLLNEDSKILLDDLYTISEEDLPSDITAQQINGIQLIIK